MYTVPSSIPADCSRNVQSELSQFINALPEGSSVEFPANGCYAQGHRIEVLRKSGLTIDGNGSEFRGSQPRTNAKLNPNWLLLRNRNVRLTDMKVQGNFHLTGTRSQQRVNADSVEGEAGATTQTNAGVLVSGGDTIHVTDMAITGTWGDGVQVSTSVPIDGVRDALATPTHIHVERVRAHKTARMCFAATQAIDYWLVDSVGSDCWYGGFDAESDFEVDKLQGIHVLRNTFRDYSSFAIWTPVPRANDNTRDIEIRNNVIETRPDGVCNQMILVGAYPNNPNQIYNAVVENNTLKERSGPGVVFDHVNGGSIRNNRDENYIEATCGHPNAIPFSRLTNSTGVVVENNGPNAAGAGGSSPPPPPPPPLPEGGSLALTAAASPGSGAAPLGVSYTYTLVNNGSDTLFRVSLVDEGCSPAAYQSGDANKDTLLQPGETWKFTCSRTFGVAGSYTGRATAGGTSSKTGLPVNSNTAQTAVTVN